MESKEQEYYPGHEYQGLFNLMHEQHGLTLLVSEMQEIVEEVRKMDSHSPTIKESLTVQHDTLQEGDWFEGMKDDYFKVLALEKHPNSNELSVSWGFQMLDSGYCVFESGGLYWDLPDNKKTQLTPEEFIRRAENTFKK